MEKSTEKNIKENCKFVKIDTKMQINHNPSSSRSRTPNRLKSLYTTNFDFSATSYKSQNDPYLSKRNYYNKKHKLSKSPIKKYLENNRKAKQRAKSRQKSENRNVGKFETFEMEFKNSESKEMRMGTGSSRDSKFNIMGEEAEKGHDDGGSGVYFEALNDLKNSLLRSGKRRRPVKGRKSIRDKSKNTREKIIRENGKTERSKSRYSAISSKTGPNPKSSPNSLKKQILKQSYYDDLNKRRAKDKGKTFEKIREASFKRRTLEPSSKEQEPEEDQTQEDTQFRTTLGTSYEELMDKLKIFDDDYKPKFDFEDRSRNNSVRPKTSRTEYRSKTPNQTLRTLENNMSSLVERKNYEKKKLRQKSKTPRKRSRLRSGAVTERGERSVKRRGVNAQIKNLKKLQNEILNKKRVKRREKEQKEEDNEDQKIFEKSFQSVDFKSTRNRLKLSNRNKSRPKQTKTSSKSPKKKQKKMKLKKRELQPPSNYEFAWRYQKNLERVDEISQQKRRLQILKSKKKQNKLNRNETPEKNRLRSKAFPLMSSLIKINKKLSNLQKAKIFVKKIGNIAGFACNSYCGAYRSKNEDRISVLLNAQKK